MNLTRCPLLSSPYTLPHASPGLRGIFPSLLLTFFFCQVQVMESDSLAEASPADSLFSLRSASCVGTVLIKGTQKPVDSADPH